jgi:glycosyltransferase involved in cell wall biosynthesis
MMDVTNSPSKISCLCVTRNRVELLKKSIRMFENQTWPHKELVIIYLSVDVATKDFLASTNNANIKSVEVAYDPELTLGDLRNISVSEANGDYICTWDDDDWFHPERLRIQIEGIFLSNKKASVFLNLLILDNTKKEAYLSAKWLWEASMMCNRQFIVDNQLIYPSINKREDTYFLRKINSPDIIIPLNNPKMYIYCFTGMNTCNQEHFHKLFLRAKKLTAETSELIYKVYNHEQLDGTSAAFLDKAIIV